MQTNIKFRKEAEIKIIKNLNHFTAKVTNVYYIVCRANFDMKRYFIINRKNKLKKYQIQLSVDIY